MSTYACEFCGESLSFRVIGGITIPLHPKGSVCMGKSMYRVEGLHRCFVTECPQCYAKVYFVRHNGGSVWLDDLGWPWPRHGCFASKSHSYPSHWERIRKDMQGAICQVWFYGILRNQSGGAFLVCPEPLERKPYLRWEPMVRLMCSPHFRSELSQLDGKMVVQLESGDCITMDGEVLRFDGPYQSGFCER